MTASDTRGSSAHTFRTMGVRLAALAAVVLTALTAAKADTACAQLYANGAPPSVQSSIPAGAGTELCFTHFAVLHSGSFRTPIYSAEALTAADAQGGDAIGRKDTFHAEDRLPVDQRATLEDYRGFKGIWDRGHMTPANDAPDFPSQRETFSLANMVPQASKLNQVLWRKLEAALHTLAEQDGVLFMVTGPIYSASPTWLHDRVAVPDYTFKAVYDPRTARAVAFVATNRNDTVCWTISIAQLVQMAAIDPFPNLSSEQKRNTTAIVDLGTQCGPAPQP